MANHDITSIKVDNGGGDIRELSVSAPSNSIKNREEKEKKKVEKVITGNVIRKKPSVSKKVTDVFLGEDIDNIKDYVIFDVMIPALKDLIFDVFSGGLSMTLFGNSTRKNSKLYNNKGNTYVSYNSMYNGSSKNSQRSITDRSRSLYNFDEIILESKAEADEVLSNLVDLIDDYGIASVGDLYDSLGIHSDFTDQSYGWMNLSSASVRRVREGYILHLPKPQLIK